MIDVPKPFNDSFDSLVTFRVLVVVAGLGKSVEKKIKFKLKLRVSIKAINCLLTLQWCIIKCNLKRAYYLNFRKADKTELKINTTPLDDGLPRNWIEKPRVQVFIVISQRFLLIELDQGSDRVELKGFAESVLAIVHRYLDLKTESRLSFGI